MPSIPQHDVDVILTQNDDASIIAAELFRLAKEQNSRFSYTILCKLAGIKSRGYLSDVLRGQRNLRLHYVEGFCAALGLSKFSTKVLRTIVELNEEKDSLRRADLRKRLDAMRQLMNARDACLKPMLGRHFFEVEMLSSLGLFGGSATAKQIAGYYSEQDPQFLEQSLERLHQDGFLTKEQDVYSVVENFVCFTGSEDGHSHLDYISYILDDTKQWAMRNFDTKGEHLFESFVISVKKEEVREYSKEVKEKFYQWVAGLNVNDGDELVRFSVHLYPVK